MNNLFTTIFYSHPELNFNDEENDTIFLLRFLYEFTILEKNKNSKNELNDLFILYQDYLENKVNELNSNNTIKLYVEGKVEIVKRLITLLTKTTFLNDMIIINNNLFDIVEYFRENDLYDKCE